MQRIEYHSPDQNLKKQSLFDFYQLDKNQLFHDDARLSRASELFPSIKRVSLVHESPLVGRPKISSSSDAISFFKEFWRNAHSNDQERFVVACLDTKNRVQSVVVVTMGTLDASLVHPREVFKPAILEGSSSVLISHNHPSGNTDPSREDIQVTERLTEAGELIGIDVLDHIIYGDGTGEAISIRECA